MKPPEGSRLALHLPPRPSTICLARCAFQDARRRRRGVHANSPNKGSRIISARRLAEANL
jgi:hypothetical protein